MFHPGYGRTVEFFLYGYMAHGGGSRRAMPMFFIRLKINHITRMYFFSFAAFALHPAAAGRNDKRLPERVGMPGSACPWFKGHMSHGYAGWVWRANKRVYSYRSSK